MAIIMDDDVDPLRRSSALTGNSMLDARCTLKATAGRESYSNNVQKIQIAVQCRILAKFASVFASCRRNHTQPRHVTSTAKRAAILRFVSPAIIINMASKGKRKREREERQVFRLVPRTMCALTSVAWHRIGFVL